MTIKIILKKLTADQNHKNIVQELKLNLTIIVGIKNLVKPNINNTWNQGFKLLSPICCALILWKLWTNVVVATIAIAEVSKTLMLWLNHNSRPF